MAQISLSLNGAFWPTSLPLFQGSWRDLLDDSYMMISLQLKGAQLSCVLAEMTILIVSYGGGILKFQITIKNGKLSLKPQASMTLEDPYPTFTGTA